VEANRKLEEIQNFEKMLEIQSKNVSMMDASKKTLINRNTPALEAHEFQANMGVVSNHTLIRSVASQVRQWCEERDQLEREPTNHLGGWCAIASAHLWRELRRKGIEAVIGITQREWYSHCYVIVEDHIVDVTATQFKEFRDLAIVVLHEREAATYDFYNTTETFSDARALRQFQKKNRWPTEQVCYEEYL
jgi:hypothetical protein